MNLVAGGVYPEFDRRLNASAETVQPAEALHVGMDFSVGRMSAVIHVLRGDNPHAVAGSGRACSTCAGDGGTTPTRLPRASIIVYPDASAGGRAKSNNASESDHAILRQAGFSVRTNAANPRVKDRALTVNAVIHKGTARGAEW